jgi:ZIP family zinc transporter
MIGFWLAIAAALATFLGYFLVAFQPRGLSKERFNGLALLVAAVAMVGVSLAELLPFALSSSLTLVEILMWFALGIAVYGLIRFSVRITQLASNRLTSSAIVLTTALTLHNIPEGAVTVAANVAGLPLGVTTAIAIAIQNIPEGLSIAAVVLAADLGKRSAFLYVAISVAAEILGASLLQSNAATITAQNTAALLTAISGIMIAVSVFELLPDGLRLTINRGVEQLQAGDGEPKH